ncbi:unnamed protein product, partial [Musa hybrid cultivar]
LDRSSGAKCYILSARELSITWADAPWYWRWRCLPESRYVIHLTYSFIYYAACLSFLSRVIEMADQWTVAELTSVCWLEIRGKIESRMLSRKTAYAAYLIYDTANYAFGLNYPSQEASVKVGVHSSLKLVCLQPTDMLSRRHAQRASALCYRKEAEEVDGAPQARNDDWMELELGEFYIDEGDDGEVNIRLLEVKGGHWKRGLIIEGIEIRPKQ